MFICLDCGAEFDEPRYEPIDYFPYGERDVPYYGHTCPHCHSTEYEDAVICEDCGEYIPDSDAIEVFRDGEARTICENCAQAAYHQSKRSCYAFD